MSLYCIFSSLLSSLNIKFHATECVSKIRFQSGVFGSAGCLGLIL